MWSALSCTLGSTCMLTQIRCDKVPKDDQMAISKFAMTTLIAFHPCVNLVIWSWRRVICLSWHQMSILRSGIVQQYSAQNWIHHRVPCSKLTVASGSLQGSVFVNHETAFWPCKGHSLPKQIVNPRGKELKKKLLMCFHNQVRCIDGIDLSSMVLIHSYSQLQVISALPIAGKWFTRWFVWEWHWFFLCETWFFVSDLQKEACLVVF